MTCVIIQFSESGRGSNNDAIKRFCLSKNKSCLYQRLSIFLAVCIVSHVTTAQFLPGTGPNDYYKGQELKIRANKLTSWETQVPLPFYSAPTCSPQSMNDSELVHSTLGEILEGDVIQPSVYKAKMNEEIICKSVCSINLNDVQKESFSLLIRDNYMGNLDLDLLPGISHRTNLEGDTKTIMAGYELGSKLLVGNAIEGQEDYYVHNHLDILVRYHIPNPDDLTNKKYRIVGFETEPRHVGEWDEEKGDDNCKNNNTAKFLSQLDVLTYSYSLTFKESELTWASRWDYLMTVEHDKNQLHWWSIVDGLMIVLFLSVTVAMILVRTLMREIAAYNELATTEEMKEETGWKLVHGDVFRRPFHSKLFCALIGSGIQILGMVCVTMLFMFLGFLKPHRRGVLLQALLVLFIFMGFPAGYVAARFHRIFSPTEWKKVTLVTALFIPCVSFSIFFVINTILWFNSATSAVEFKTLVVLLVMCFGISVPLVFMGAVFAGRKDPIELPVPVNSIPRQIPARPWYVDLKMTMLLGGVLPFGATFTELVFVMNALWHNNFYTFFGFLPLVLVIFIVICGEVSITFCYFQLTAEDYKWWWPSFLNSAGSAIFVAIFTVIYYGIKLQHMGLIASIIYVGYMGLLCLYFFLLAGAAGACSTFLFVKAIYGSIKID